MLSDARAAGKQAYRFGRPKKLPENGEIDKQWGPDWEDEWLAGWKEAEQEHLPKQTRSQEEELEI